MKVAVIGLGKLGLPFAAWLASKGHKILGVDSNKVVIDALRRANIECPIQEPGLEELLQQVQGRFWATSDAKAAIKEAEAVFIVVPTPSNPDGSFDASLVFDVGRTIASVLAKTDEYKLVVLVSTVMPGQTDFLKLLLEKHSGKKCGTDFGLCYNPEFVALGSVLRDMAHPDFVLIGESDSEARERLEIILDQYNGDDRVPAYHTNFINAELAKLSINTFLTMKITFACMMARLAEKLPGADVDVMSDIIGADSRIGRKYLTGANGFGGPCFPRDNQALAQLAYQLGVSSRLPRSVIEENEGQIWVINALACRLAGENKTALFMGMAYKPGTPVTEESQGKRFLEGMKSLTVDWYDPMAKGSLLREAAQAAIYNAGVVIVMQPDPDFLDFNYGDTPVIDCWRLLRKNQPKNWHPMGIGPHD